MKEKAAYLRGLIEGLGIDETTKEGKGIKAMNLTDKTGGLAGQLLVRSDEDILIITDDGTIIRTAVADISPQSRSTQGVRMMRLAGDSRVVAVTATEKVEETPEAEAIELAHAQASEALAEGAVPADEALAEDLGYQGDEEADIARLLDRAEADDDGNDTPEDDI